MQRKCSAVYIKGSIGFPVFCEPYLCFLLSVKIMAEKLDPEQLGVITLNGFLEEFFSTGKSDADDKQTFTVYHYNGLPQSCPDSKV